ncbi:serine hydrolase [Micromonospora sp. NPDC049891]|uniref:serine hydrolase n=1 Tax=Micromonospora sp. NPDC049891 TaxID=3155655 RepID=UPI0033FD003D
MTVGRLLRTARETLRDAGLRGCLLVRDLDSGDELGLDADVVLPVASLVKVPLAVATVDRIERGELDGAAGITVAPGRVRTPGPTGLSRFRHPATVAIDDLLYLSVAISDEGASDALFALTPPSAVAGTLRRFGIDGISVRHPTRDLTDTPAERFAPDEVHLAHSLAAAATTAGQGHPVAQLDAGRANSGSARAFVELLHALWRPSRIPTAVAGRVRELMGDNLLRQRLAPDFSSDAARWSSKTGTLLNLRHEVGVVEHADGQAYAVAALSESTVPAAVQPQAEAVLAQVARELHDALRAARG